jgi:hypothetical protein
MGPYLNAVYNTLFSAAVIPKFCKVSDFSKKLSPPGKFPEMTIKLAKLGVGFRFYVP